MRNLNTRQRYQKYLVLEDLYPSIHGYCACGCGKELNGHKYKWYSKKCSDGAYTSFCIVKGNTSIIRQELFKIDKGVCRQCSKYSDKWDADHILPVAQGGGGCTLDNYQTLCETCHKEKTKEISQTKKHYAYRVAFRCTEIEFRTSFIDNKTLINTLTDYGINTSNLIFENSKDYISNYQVEHIGILSTCTKPQETDVYVFEKWYPEIFLAMCCQTRSPSIKPGEFFIDLNGRLGRFNISNTNTKIRKAGLIDFINLYQAKSNNILSEELF